MNSITCKNPNCRYEWIPRKANPKCCPVCKRYLIAQKSPPIPQKPVKDFSDTNYAPVEEIA